jgi:membrane-associated phospholipid phosphatase
MVNVYREGGPSGPGRRAIVASRQRRGALVAAAAFVVVLIAVTTGATQALDRVAADWFRPNDEWGMAQARLGPIIDGLEPTRAYVFLGLVTSIVSLQRRSWRPAVFAGLVAGMSVGATSVVKVLTHRPDPSGYIASTGGSFPSGHVVALLACLGCCALLLWRRTRWWQWVLVAIPPAVMATALLYAAAHWLTDVLGGALLAVATLCWAASLPLRAAMTEPRRVADGATGRGRTVALENP